MFELLRQFISEEVKHYSTKHDEVVEAPDYLVKSFQKFVKKFGVEEDIKLVQNFRLIAQARDELPFMTTKTHAQASRTREWSKQSPWVYSHVVVVFSRYPLLKPSVARSIDKITYYEVSYYPVDAALKLYHQTGVEEVLLTFKMFDELVDVCNSLEEFDSEAKRLGKYLPSERSGTTKRKEKMHGARIHKKHHDENEFEEKLD